MKSTFQLRLQIWLSIFRPGDLRHVFWAAGLVEILVSHRESGSCHRGWGNFISCIHRWGQTAKWVQLYDVIDRWRSSATKTNLCRDVIGKHHLHCAKDGMAQMCGQSPCSITCEMRMMKWTKAEGAILPCSTVDPVKSQVLVKDN